MLIGLSVWKDPPLTSPQQFDFMNEFNHFDNVKAHPFNSINYAREDSGWLFVLLFVSCNRRQNVIYIDILFILLNEFHWVLCFDLEIPVMSKVPQDTQCFTTCILHKLRSVNFVTGEIIRSFQFMVISCINNSINNIFGK